MGIELPDFIYQDYVQRHTATFGLSEAHELLAPTGDKIDGFPGILIKFDSMPVWMGDKHIIFDPLLDAGLPSLSMPPFHGLKFPEPAPGHDLSFRHLVIAYKDDAKSYRAKIIHLLKEEIKKRLSGQYLLDEFKGKYVVTIVPYHGDEINADVVVTSDAREAHSTALGKPVTYRHLGRPRTWKDYGDGRGTDCTVEFNPDLYSGTVSAEPGDAADEVLYHELVHAARAVNGKMDHIPMNKHYTNAEEFLAIMLTNIYMSEKGQTKLRGGHQGYINILDRKNIFDREGNNILDGKEILDGEEHERVLGAQDTHRFLDNPQHMNLSPLRIIENFRNQINFYMKLSHLPFDRPKFNPVRQYELDRPQYLKKLQGNFTM
jgi:Effector protein